MQTNGQNGQKKLINKIIFSNMMHYFYAKFESKISITKRLFKFLFGPELLSIIYYVWQIKESSKMSSIQKILVVNSCLPAKKLIKISTSFSSLALALQFQLSSSLVVAPQLQLFTSSSLALALQLQISRALALQLFSSRSLVLDL